MFLESHFGDVELHMGQTSMDTDSKDDEVSSGPRLIINVDGTEANIDLLTMVRH
jgi:hypothetical protein